MSLTPADGFVLTEILPIGCNIVISAVFIFLGYISRISVSTVCYTLRLVGVC